MSHPVPKRVWRMGDQNLISCESYPGVDSPCYIESTIAALPTGDDGAEELWKLNHYYDRLDDWNNAHGIPKNPFAGPPADPFFELHNLATDPEERHNRAADDKDNLSRMQSVLEQQRDAKRNLPAHRNPSD